MNRASLHRWGLVVGLLLATATPSGQREAGGRGLLAESLRRHESASMEYAGDLTTITRNGTERRKTWRSYRAGNGREAQRLIVFLSPADVRGVAFLSRGRQGGPPDQWIYLPSMGRERRLAEVDLDTRFAGTDFTFEDLAELDPDRYTVDQLPDVSVGGAPAHRLRLVPRGRSAYALELLTFRPADLMLLMRESQRHGDTSPSKRLVLSEFKETDGRVTAMQLELADLTRGSRTMVRLSDVRFNRPQPADRFTLQYLPQAAVR